MLSASRLLRPRPHHRRLLSTSPNPNPKPNENPKPIEKPVSLRSLTKPILEQKDADAVVSLFNLSSSDPRFRRKSSLYNAAVLRLKSLNRPDAVEALIEHQKSYPEFATSEPFAALLICLYGRAHMPSHALSTFNSLPFPPSSLSLNSLLFAFARDPNPDPTRLTRLLQQHPDIALTVVSYNIVISALCHNLQFTEAIELIKLMESKGIAPDIVTYNTLLHGFYSNGRFEDGEKIWETMEEKDVRSYNSRLRGWVSAKGVTEAAKLFDEMLERGVKPDIYTFNALLKGYCESGMLEEAKGLYLRLKENKCKPQLTTFHMLIPAVLEANEYDFAVQLCNESLKVGFLLEMEILQRVVNNLAEKGMLDKAKKLVEHVTSKDFYADNQLTMPLTCLAV